MKNQLSFRFSRYNLVHTALLISLICSAVYVTPAHAAGIVVNTEVDETTTNGLCSLREAIANANNDASTNPDCAAGSGADTISFAGDYTINLASQLPNITTDITINGNGAGKTIIQANVSYNIFRVGDYKNGRVISGNLSLNQMTLQNASQGVWVLKRSALAVTNSLFTGHTSCVISADIDVRLSVTDSIFRNNSGCGIVAFGSDISVKNSAFNDNSGGISASGNGWINVTNSTFTNTGTGINGGDGTTLTITDSTFTNNNQRGISFYGVSARVVHSTFIGNSSTGGAGGIAAFNMASISVRDSTFTNNTGGIGGALYISTGFGASVSNSTFNGNQATGKGGAIYAESLSGMDLKDSTFSNNTAETGGALSFFKIEVWIDNSVLNGNSASANGGGIYGESVTLNITNSTFGTNSAVSGGGIDLLKSGASIISSTFSGNTATTIGGSLHGDGAGLTLTNTIVANSLSGENCAGGIINGGHNLDSGTSCKWGKNKGSLSNTDPRLGPLADNGGPTLTFALLEGSPAIDKGDDNVCKDVDQRGMIRPQGAHCDIGAYEADYRPVISGNAGAGGAILSYTDGIDKTVTADSKGNYSLSVTLGWSGTVTPSKTGQRFTPVTRSYSNVQSDQANQDYTAQPATGGADTTGVFRPSNGLLYLKNKNESGFADIALNYGMGGDHPITGDWDGNGTDTVGVYRNGTFYLRNSNTNGFAEIVFAFGQAGDQPIAGDWNGDGVDTIGVFRNGTFYLRNTNDAGAPDATFGLGNPGDIGVAGDWNGDGIDTTGVFRPSNGVIFLKNKNETGFADIALNYGLPGDRPVTGDWNNDGTDTIGIYRAGTFYLRNFNTNGFAQLIFALGDPGDMPLAGNWDGVP